ncbi:tyrosine-type recombinase/integrase [Halococcus salsus]|uniref:tyrosine-type recombinase/integrase n=1 Tax=Halococcus salsus TaxID=2162894 RepID=UPI00135C2712|nr:site-specific integrase [Halococcus salsus]
MVELEPITPSEAKDLYLAQREGEVSEETLQSHHYRLKSFVSWLDDMDVRNMNSLTSRHIHKFRLFRKEEKDINKVTVRTQLSTIRVFVKFLESIDAVEQGLSEKILVPKMEGNENVRDRLLSSEQADNLLEYLRRYEYASRTHAMLEVLWSTGCRMGGLHSLDLGDFNREERSLAFRHRPSKGTRLKNKHAGERLVALPNDVADVLSDYIEVNRNEVEDDHGRSPLFTTSGNRMGKSQIRSLIYSATRPCQYGEECPHSRDPDECEANSYKDASKCPSSVSPHDIRRGGLTHLLKEGMPKEVVSDRANVEEGVLDKHYNKMTEQEKMEQRRDHLDNL